jgi:hypothetical protein
LTAVNVVVEAPMPKAKASTATALNAGVFTSIRAAYLKSPSMFAATDGKDSLGSDPILDYPAVEQMHRAIGVLGKTRVVRDHANGGAAGVQFL